MYKISQNLVVSREIKKRGWEQKKGTVPGASKPVEAREKRMSSSSHLNPVKLIEREEEEEEEVGIKEVKRRKKKSASDDNNMGQPG